MPRGRRDNPITGACHECDVAVTYWGTKPPANPMRCRPCARRQESRLAKARGRKQDPEYLRAYRLRTQYGLSPEAYESMAAEQGNVCAVCSEACTTGRRLAVDHDHATGAVRGLLCHRCNRAIGLLGDDRALVQRAADYLRKEGV